ncbi:RICIN domain-containing protein [Streptomyces sp. NPDC001523]|uniref:RICIN domain-containing protein n=1 Tax=Streptomyces sp. NPDC001523 TaxID=3154383 RepID=UPI003318591C
MADDGRPGAGPAQRLGDALRALQQRSGRTLRSLETEVSISDSSLSRYFRGSTVPPWTTVRDLCVVLKADPTEYRLLWEEAERAQPRPPVPTEAAPVTGDPPDENGASAEGAPASPRTRRAAWTRAVRTRMGSRRVCATTGALAGALVGALLAVLVLRTVVDTGHTSGDPRAAAAPNGGPIGAGSTSKGPGSGPGTAENARIFVNRNTGDCLDDSLEKGLRSFDCNGMSYQRWTVESAPDGTRQLRNHATGACLDAGGTGLRTSGCAAAASQKWVLTAWGDASVEVRSKATGACLDDGPAGLRDLDCDRTNHQRWG